MPSPAAWTIYYFGITSLATGLYFLINPQAQLMQLQLPQSAIAAANGNALGATGMGIYYTLAAYQENRSFFWLTVPMRLLTTAVFATGGFGRQWVTVAMWEGSGALITLAALLAAR